MESKPTQQNKFFSALKRLFSNGVVVRNVGGKKICIIGSGNLGTKLAIKLVERGAEVIITRRNRNKIKRVAREVFRKGSFKGLDIVLLLKNEKNYDETECFMLVQDVFSNIIKK